MGSIYQRKGTRYLWMKYYDRTGKAIRESTGSDKREVAKRLLKVREGHIAEGRVPGLYFDKVLLRELAIDFLIDYEVRDNRSVARAEQCVAHLVGKVTRKNDGVEVDESGYFGSAHAVDIKKPEINGYINFRQGKGIKNGTINRELAALKRMLRIGKENEKVEKVPSIPKLGEPDPKEDFFDTEDFITFREHLPEYLRGMVTLGFKYGFRLGELRNLRWSKVHRKEGYIRLAGKDEKNKKGRKVYLDDEAREILRRQYVAQHVTGRDSERYVFQNGGKQFRDFRGAWNKACAAIGRTGYSDGGQQEGESEALTFHSLRRTAIRNMVRAGVKESVAMKISGHKTRSVFDRYNITDDTDLQDAALKIGGVL